MIVDFDAKIAGPKSKPKHNGLLSVRTLLPFDDVVSLVFVCSVLLANVEIAAVVELVVDVVDDVAEADAAGVAEFVGDDDASPLNFDG